ncbi:hypothetical protein EYV94_02285 [Puteibacter caeruleilacunae]|nr:hypothetical protein EYV94_02285 [Puteibacter caeruleilacunae]
MNRRQIIVSSFVLGIAVLLMGCSGGLKTPTLAFGKPLPDKYNSPDGMTLGKDNCIYLSMNNVNDFTHPAKVLCITEDDQLEEIVQLPAHPETGVASPLGLVFASDGNLYVSDNQSFASEKPGLSRIIKVTMNNGKATGCKVVALGFNMANGITTKGDRIYIAETNLNAGKPHKSGVYSFTLAELNSESPIVVKGLGDSHLITSFVTKNEDHPVGANGVAFNSKGELFVCNFGDAQVLKFIVDDNAKVQSQEIFAQGGGMMSVDGMQIDKEDNLWIADFLGNAVVKISPTGEVMIVSKNGQTDGANGELDAPSECIRRGDRVYVSNIDLTYGDNKADKVHTMSLIEL